MDTIFDIALNLFLMFLGIVVALAYENLGAPRLEIRTSDTTDGYRPGIGRRVRFLHLNVINNPRKLIPVIKIRLPFITRQTAYACKTNVVFFDDRGNQVGSSIPLRWDSNPEPIKPEMDNSGNIVLLGDNRLLRISRFMDIPPDQSETSAFALRIEGDSEAYGWSSDNYQYPEWRHPACVLPSGNYIARVTITSGDYVVTKDITFANPPAFDDFDIK